jgi:UDP-N-acetylmuramate--alanine ligase
MGRTNSQDGPWPKDIATARDTRHRTQHSPARSTAEQHLMQHVHFIGIGGAGTSGLAEILLMRGVRVSGSDLVPNSKTAELEALGAAIHLGHDASNVSDPELVVFSSAVHRDNPEIVEARKRGIPVMRRAEFMAELLKDHKVIAVAGTHGKTTVTSMIASILIEAKLDPLVLVGASVRELANKNSRPGAGRIAVVEADEYDRSFLVLKPFIAVMTSLEEEHLDIYKDLDDLKNTFVQFANQGPSTFQTGFAVVCIDEPALRTITPRLEKRIVAYGIRSADAKYRATDLTVSEHRTRATVVRGNEPIGQLELRVPGEHNVYNALAAIAVGEILSIPFEISERALKRFTGAERRFERIGEAGGVVVIDDYAHHPTEVRETLITVRRCFPDRRIVVCFQPHTFTRTRDFAVPFGQVFAELADVVVLLDIYPAREEPIEGVTTKLIFDAAQEAGLKEGYLVASEDELPEMLGNVLRPGDVVLTVGAGTITNAAPLILE